MNKPVIRFARSLRVWGTADFEGALKAEIEHMGVEQLPLQQGLSTSSYALGDDLSVMIIRVSDGENFIRVKAGIFYRGIIAGCSCADDPTPIGENNEYCEVQLEIDKATAETTVELLKE